MMGMGAALSPEEMKRVQEHIAKRKEEVLKHRAEFEGKTVEEIKAEEEHEHHHGCDCDHEHETAPDFSFEEDGIDEEAVLAYIRSRQDVLDRARRTCRSQYAEIQHLKNQLKISDKKVSALQIALGKLREELKVAKAAGQPAPAEAETATEQPVQA